MFDSADPSIGPVTADDLARVVELALSAIHGATRPNWSARAGTLDWDCWETVDHMSDQLVGFAAQLGLRNPPRADPLPFGRAAQRPGGPKVAVYADRASGPTGLLQLFEASAALLAAMIPTWQEQSGIQPFGAADPADYAAAIGVGEVLVHSHDVAKGLRVSWIPPEDICQRVLARLQPNAPANMGGWPTLLWATGRGELVGQQAVKTWRWHAGPGD